MIKFANIIAHKINEGEDKETIPFYFKVELIDGELSNDDLFEGGEDDIWYPITCFYDNSEAIRKLKRYAINKLTEEECKKVRTLTVGARGKSADRQWRLAKKAKKVVSNTTKTIVKEETLEYK